MTRRVSAGQALPEQTNKQSGWYKYYSSPSLRRGYHNPYMSQPVGTRPFHFWYVVASVLVRVTPQIGTRWMNPNRQTCAQSNQQRRQMPDTGPRTPLGSVEMLHDLDRDPDIPIGEFRVFADPVNKHQLLHGRHIRASVYART